MRNVATRPYGHIAKLLSLAALFLSALGFLSAPMGALAQNDPQGGQENSTVSNKIVKLDLESADLYYALKLLFSQIKADFTLPPALRGTLITVRLNQPFRIAMETVLKASGLPLTWKLENGVYSIIQIENEPTEAPLPATPEEETPQERRLPFRLRVNNISGVDIVAMLGGRFIPFTGSGSFAGFNPFAGRGGGGFGGGGQGGFGGGGLGGGGLGGGGFGGGGLGGGGLGGGGFGGGGFGGGGGLGGGFGGGGFGGGGRIGGGRGY